jgi:hypothetical protein
MDVFSFKSVWIKFMSLQGGRGDGIDCGANDTLPFIDKVYIIGEKEQKEKDDHSLSLIPQRGIYGGR